MNGLSNSRSVFTQSTWGVDTCALRFQGLGGWQHRPLLDEAPSFPHGHRGRLLAEKHPTGARAVWYPEAGTVKVECRLAALVDGTSQASRLGTRTELVALPDLAAGVLADLTGVTLARDEVARSIRAERHTLGRVDLTGELLFNDPADGLAFLRATMGLTPPGYKTKPIWGNDGQPQTVYTVTAKRGRNVARFYDSGLKHGSAPRGTLIRYEVANALPTARGITPAAIAATPDTMPSMYGKHLRHFVEHAKETTVTTAQDAPRQIARLVADGTLTTLQASGLAGFAAMLPYGGRHLYSDQSARRYLRLLRKYGVVLTGSEQEAALTIGQALDALLAGATAASEAQEPQRVAA